MTLDEARSALFEAIGLSQAQFAAPNGPGLDAGALSEAVEAFEKAVRKDVKEGVTA